MVDFSEKISRRGFLELAGKTTAGAALTACTPGSNPPPPPQGDDEQPLPIPQRTDATPAPAVDTDRRITTIEEFQNLLETDAALTKKATEILQKHFAKPERLNGDLSQEAADGQFSELFKGENPVVEIQRVREGDDVPEELQGKYVIALNTEALPGEHNLTAFHNEPAQEGTEAFKNISLTLEISKASYGISPEDISIDSADVIGVDTTRAPGASIEIRESQPDLYIAAGEGNRVVFENTTPGVASLDELNNPSSHTTTLLADPDSPVELSLAGRYSNPYELGTSHYGTSGEISLLQGAEPWKVQKIVIPGQVFENRVQGVNMTRPLLSSNPADVLDQVHFDADLEEHDLTQGAGWGKMIGEYISSNQAQFSVGNSAAQDAPAEGARR